MNAEILEAVAAVLKAVVRAMGPKAWRRRHHRQGPRFTETFHGSIRPCGFPARKGAACRKWHAAPFRVGVSPELGGHGE